MKKLLRNKINLIIIILSLILLIKLIFQWKLDLTSYYIGISKAKNIDTIMDNIDIDIIGNLRKEYNNNEIIGLISIPNTAIREPVLQTSNNNYYLNHYITKEYYIYGSIYMDYRIDLNYSNKILIYGHSAINKSLNLVPFNELEEYYSKDYYDIHKYIILELDSGVRTYEIFSVYIETSDFSYLELNFSSNDTWYNHLLSLKNNSIYETNVDITPYDEILILQTCSNSKDYSNYPEKYLLIVAKRI